MSYHIGIVISDFIQDENSHHYLLYCPITLRYSVSKFEVDHGWIKSDGCTFFRDALAGILGCSEDEWIALN